MPGEEVLAVSLTATLTGDRPSMKADETQKDRVLRPILPPAILLVLLATSSAVAAQVAEQRPAPHARIPTTQVVILFNTAPPDRKEVSSGFSDSWAAAKSLYFDYADRHQFGSEVKAFWAALRLVVDDELAEAINAFERLLGSAIDAEVRGYSSEILALLYENEDQTEALLQLVDRNPELIELGVVDPGDLALMRASIEVELPPFSVGTAEAPIEVPLRFSFAGTPVVSVRLNETHEEVFWLDTGSSGTLLATDVAEAASVRYLTESIAVQNQDAELRIRSAVVDQLAIGALNLENVRVGVVDRAFLSIAGHRIAGIIGWPILRELRLQFDGPKGTLTLETASSPDPRKEDFFWFDYPFVKLLAADGTPLNFGLDTGADVTRIRPELLDRVSGLEPIAIGSRSAALGGVASSLEQMLEEVDFLLPDALLRFRYVKTADVAHSRFVVPDGRLGADILRQARVTIDHRAGVFRVEPSVPD